MDIVKKNWLSIACGVIALIAVAAIPTYVSNQQKALQAQLKTRKDTFDQLNAMKTKQRHLPVVSLDPNATPAELTQFPGPKVIDAGLTAVKNVQAQSVKLKQAADGMNVHKLLVAGCLPVAQNPFEFQQTYASQFEPNGPLAKELDSVAPPTDQEIQAERDRRIKQYTEEQPKDKATGKIFGEDALDQKISQMEATLAQDMRLDAATNHKMYMAVTALSEVGALAPSAGGVKAPDPDTIWYAQLGYWVQKDVIDAVAGVNKNSRNVAQSPVKQLISLEVPPESAIYAMPAAASGTTPAAAGNNGPASPVANNSDTDPLPKDFSVSPTGRVCNGVFDVVHFTLTLNVEASKVNQVIQALERSRLITVYATDVQSVNSVQQEQDGYFFGPNPVVTLTMQCEELFMRDWTRQYMPPSIRQMLNVQEPPAQPTASAQ
ncbi:MAG TPA: hypothetical protein VN541_21605 [Tepidisphaeraceae bacterium]|nr:hypothetical protein [Tepidisphaeraceae bacterium]